MYKPQTALPTLFGNWTHKSAAWILRVGAHGPPPFHTSEDRGQFSDQVYALRHHIVRTIRLVASFYTALVRAARASRVAHAIAFGSTMTRFHSSIASMGVSGLGDYTHPRVWSHSIVGPLSGI
jgi:hypothetical protein